MILGIVTIDDAVDDAIDTADDETTEGFHRQTAVSPIT